MATEEEQTYGLFVPHLNMMLTVKTTYSNFQSILKEFNLDPKGSYRPPTSHPYVEKFDDFDYVVE